MLKSVLGQNPFQIVSGVAGTGKTSLAYAHIAASLFGSSDLHEAQSSSSMASGHTVAPAAVLDSPRPLCTTAGRRGARRLVTLSTPQTAGIEESSPIVDDSEDVSPGSALTLALEKSAQKHVLFLARSPRLTEFIGKSVDSELRVLDDIVAGAHASATHEKHDGRSFRSRFSAMSWERFLLRSSEKAIVAECPGLMGDLSPGSLLDFVSADGVKKPVEAVATVCGVAEGGGKRAGSSLRTRRAFDAILQGLISAEDDSSADVTGVAGRVLQAFDRWCLERAEIYFSVSGKAETVSAARSAGVVAWEELKRLASGVGGDAAEKTESVAARAYMLVLIDAFSNSSLEFAQLVVGHGGPNSPQLGKTGFFGVLEIAGKWAGREYRRALQEAGKADPWAAPYAGLGAFLQYLAVASSTKNLGATSEAYLHLQHVAASVEAGLIDSQRASGIGRSFFGLYIPSEKVSDLEQTLLGYQRHLQAEFLADPTVLIEDAAHGDRQWTNIVVDEAQLFAPLEYLRLMRAAGFFSFQGGALKTVGERETRAKPPALLSFFLDENQQFGGETPSGKVAELKRLGRRALGGGSSSDGSDHTTSSDSSSEQAPRMVSLASNLRSYPPICHAATAVLAIRNKFTLDFSHAASEVVSGLDDSSVGVEIPVAVAKAKSTVHILDREQLRASMGADARYDAAVIAVGGGNADGGALGGNTLVAQLGLEGSQYSVREVQGRRLEVLEVEYGMGGSA